MWVILECSSTYQWVCFYGYLYVLVSSSLVMVLHLHHCHRSNPIILGTRCVLVVIINALLCVSGSVTNTNGLGGLNVSMLVRARHLNGWTTDLILGLVDVH